MNIKLIKQIVIFVVITVLLAAAVVVLMIMDEKRAGRKRSEKNRQEFLKQVMEMQKKQEPKTTLDDARKGLPDADKVDFNP